MTQPKLPFFDRLETSNVEPPEPKKSAGTKAGLPEAAQYMNWLFVQGWQWFRGLQGAYADIVVGTAQQKTDKEATHTIADFAAAVANGDKILILDGTQTLAANVLITETDVEVYFQTEAIIAKASTFTFTMSGARSRIFNGRFSGFGTNDLVLSGGSSLWHISEGLTAWFNVGTSQVIGPGFIKTGTQVHVISASAGAPAPYIGADELVLEGSGEAGLTILGGATSLLRIAFGDSGSSTDGVIAYKNAAAGSQEMQFHVNGALRLTINGSGDVAIDSTTPSTSPTTGSIVIAGGAGIALDLFVGGKISGQQIASTGGGSPAVGYDMIVGSAGEVSSGAADRDASDWAANVNSGDKVYFLSSIAFVRSETFTGITDVQIDFGPGTNWTAGGFTFNLSSTSHRWTIRNMWISGFAASGINIQSQGVQIYVTQGGSPSQFNMAGSRSFVMDASSGGGFMQSNLFEMDAAGKITLASVDVTGTTPATSTTTGSIVAAGGAGIALALWVGGLVNIAGILSVDTINEKTAATGVTIDGLTIKDSGFKTGGTAIIRPGGIILSSVTDVTRTTAGGFLNLTVPANTLNGDGKTIRARAFGVTSGAGTKLIKFSWDATDFAALIVAAGSQDWSLECIIVRESLDNQQGVQTGMESAGAQICDVKDFTGDESTNLDLVVTLQSIGGGDCTMKAVVVELI